VSRRRPVAVPRGAPVTAPLTVYSTQWCGYCHRLMKQLDREQVGYAVVDIEQDPSAADYVMSVNGGNQTVPTVVFPDGSAMTNPSLAQVKERLAGLAG
jgi:mycoredoxin